MHAHLECSMHDNDVLVLHGLMDDQLPHQHVQNILWYTLQEVDLEHHGQVGVGASGLRCKAGKEGGDRMKQHSEGRVECVSFIV